MAATRLAPAFDYFLDFVVTKATPEEILAFQLPESERQRAIDLLDKQDEGTLTPDELAELEQIAELDGLVSMLKARALFALQTR